MTKLIASLSLDLDNKWCYLRTHGAPSWEQYPSYLNVAVPRILRACVARDLRVTCFVVGRDAEREENADALASLAAAGHEIGNHTLNHFPWIHSLGREQLEAEIAVAEEVIERATGQRPVGFRSPAYSLSHAALEILAERGYEYDATTLPTYLGPLARWFFRRTATPEAVAEAERRQLFGSFRDGLRPIKPYAWTTAAGTLVELPVTTFPVVKLPIHMTYLMYLWQFSPLAARTYFRMSMTACRLMNVTPSMLLHPLDFLGAEDDAEMRFFPGMKVAREEKLAFVDEVLEYLTDRYQMLPLCEHAEHVRQQLGIAAPTRPQPVADAVEANGQSLVSDLVG